MSKIIDDLRKYDKAYYEGNPLISDLEYDELRRKAESDFSDHPYFQEVGTIVKANKVKLPYVLGSLQKYRIEDIDKWLDSHNLFVASGKADGSSVYVEYDNGEVVFAATRGNGEYGMDITHKMQRILPSIFYRYPLKIRGEAVLKGDSYEELGLKNRRNGVAGLLNREDYYGCDHIDVVFYEVISCGACRNEIESGKLLFLQECKLETVPFHVFESPDPEALIDILVEMKAISTYDIDGLVLTDIEYKRENVKKPKHKICFKVNEEAQETKVKSVEWNVSRTGRLVPVIHIDPVEIDGALITKATGHNAEYVVNNKIGEGAEIGIIRSNSVIPYIVDVYKDAKHYGHPYKCPSCGEPVEWRSVDLVCNFSLCPAQSLHNTEYFLRTLGAENITSKTLEKIGVTEIEQAYEINPFDLLVMDGIGPRRSEQIVEEIEKTLSTLPSKLLAAFGIRFIGNTVAEKITMFYSIDDLMEGVSIEDLIKIEGIGPEKAKSLVENINKYKDLYEFLKKKGLKFTEQEEDSKIKGMTIVLTGGHPFFKRDVLKRMVNEKGASIKGISKSVDYVVAADPSTNSNKARKARDYGIPIISYEDFFEMAEIKVEE